MTYNEKKLLIVFTVTSYFIVIGTVVVQFNDQSAGEHKFEIKKGTSVVKTFVFTKINSIKDRTIENGTMTVDAPVCSTAPVFVQFSQMKYRKTGNISSADDYMYMELFQ